VNLEQFLARLKASAGAMSAKQMSTLAVAFLAVVSLTIGSAYWLNAPTYGVLFSDLDAESASSVVGKLKTQKVEYLLEDGGKTIRVPANRVDELRLQFASDGMPGSGHVGFELFDRTAFGVTDFLEHVNYRRALEGELARTISTIAEVAGARVHIAMPQPSLFTGRDQPTKASVILKLRNKRELPASTVAAITGLVSASVESLRPEAVVIIDNYGRPLSKPDTEGESAGGVPLERQQQIERDLTTRVVTLLEPIVGSGRVRVNVSAKLNTGTQEETEEHWDPTPVIRSQQSVVQTAGGPAPAQGVAGSRSNLPPEGTTPDAPPAPTPVAGTLASGHTAETTNYELSKTTRHRLQPRGDIVKLSVAVLLDDAHQAAAGEAGQPASTTVKPRSAADLQKIQGLVAAAVGLDQDRGDQLTVENIAFEDVPVEEVVAPSPWQKYAPQAFDAARILGVILLGVAAIFGVIRPMVTGTLAPRVKAASLTAGAAAAIGARTVKDLEAEMDAQLESGSATKLPVLSRRMAALTQKEPENAARLLRAWLAEEQ
jgi:flagellar M-ring protein FliF